MNRAAIKTEIRTGGQSDLPAVYEIARDALTLDRFSEDLIGETLFSNPNPDRDQYGLLIAQSEGKPIGFMQTVARASQGRGWIGLFAVREPFRRTGVASALLSRALNGFGNQEIADVSVLGIPCNYFTPGLDPRYTEAHCFLVRSGFEKTRDCSNLIADLSQQFDTDSDETRLLDEGLEIRRAAESDADLLATFFSEQFGEDWHTEAKLAMRAKPCGLHLAIQNGRIIAFSGHSSQNREWGFFGPMGTTPAARGKGIGRVLLRRCLNDLRDAGHKTAIIPWVGPIPFYMHHAHCRVDRVFWLYQYKPK